MISHKLKFIFIHIPKTSGNSLSLFLNKYIDNKVITITNKLGKNQGIVIKSEFENINIKHKKINYYHDTYGKKINDYYKFSIVRNPYDRILSYYFWAKGMKNKNFIRDEFKKFIILNKSILYQNKYVDKSVNIIYFENLINELKNIELFKNIVNFDNYPMVNKSNNSTLDWRDVYDKELKDLVYKLFKKDFLYFGYKY
jgi:hypothetical protein